MLFIILLYLKAARRRRNSVDERTKVKTLGCANVLVRTQLCWEDLCSHPAGTVTESSRQKPSIFSTLCCADFRLIAGFSQTLLRSCCVSFVIVSQLLNSSWKSFTLRSCVPDLWMILCSFHVLILVLLSSAFCSALHCCSAAASFLSEHKHKFTQPVCSPLQHTRRLVVVAGEFQFLSIKVLVS